MFTKESLYINVVKYDNQLKLDYKKLSNEQITTTDNSVFLVDNDSGLPLDIAHKLNSSQSEIDNTYISTLLINDTTKLIPKVLSSKLKDCEIASFNNDFDIAVLKTTLFETKNYFAKTGIDYIYSAFHLINLHIDKNVSRSEIIVFLFNSKAFIVILDAAGIIVHNTILDLACFDTIKKTHFYEDDIDGQKLFDEIYYLELNEIIHNTLNAFYEKKSNTFVEKVTPKALDAVPDKTAFKPLYILMAVLIVLTPLGLLATGTAWGEWGADEIAGLVSGGSQLGYTPSGMTNGFELSTLFPDYSMSGLPEWTGYILSAIVGVALLVIIFKIISSMMKEKVDFKKKAA